MTTTLKNELSAILEPSISEIIQRSIFRRLGAPMERPVGSLSREERSRIMASLEESIRLFAPGESSNLIARCKSTLGLESGLGFSGPLSQSSKSLAITTEQDIAAARSEAWSEALRIGLTKFASVKVATVVSELARNIVFYAGRGTVELKVEERDKRLCLMVIATDQGPGIEPEKLRQILGGTYQSDRGLGRGLIAVKKLAEDFHLDTAPGMGTTVRCMFKGA